MFTSFRILNAILHSLPLRIPQFLRALLHVFPIHINVDQRLSRHSHIIRLIVELLNNAIERTGDLHARFIGLDLAQLVEVFHACARLDEPLNQLTLGDAFSYVCQEERFDYIEAGGAMESASPDWSV